ncbi:MAG TPA: hypothetical protein VFI03_04315 [Solirubrobacterales bacterium]|nr:hypothetical protein [Solirubrobacterales bacterium]
MAGKEKAPFYEQRWFQGTVAVVGLAGALWAFSGAPKPWDVAADISATEFARANTQIILDASAGMAEPFGEGTKLEAATEAIRDYVVPLQEEGLALRRTGRSCDEGGELLVDFGKDHSDDVAEEAAAQRAEGESSLAYAVIEAISEFTASENFQGPASTRQVVIIAGAAEDECLDNAPAEIRRRLDSSGIDATFKMVALKPSQGTREQLASFTEALGEHAEVEFVETEEELEEVVSENLKTLAAEIGDLPELPETNETTDTVEEETTEEEGSGEEGEGTTPETEEEGGESGSEGSEGAAPEVGSGTPSEEAPPEVP